MSGTSKGPTTIQEELQEPGGVKAKQPDQESDAIGAKPFGERWPKRAPVTFVVTGNYEYDEGWGFDGVFGEVRGGPYVYYMKEEPDSIGYYSFLYPVSGGHWVLGRGKTYEEREAYNRVSGGTII